VWSSNYNATFATVPVSSAASGPGLALIAATALAGAYAVLGALFWRGYSFTKYVFFRLLVRVKRNDRVDVLLVRYLLGFGFQFAVAMLVRLHCLREIAQNGCMRMIPGRIFDAVVHHISNCCSLDSEWNEWFGVNDVYLVENKRLESGSHWTRSYGLDCVVR
jgi:hypothetical protein